MSRIFRGFPYRVSVRLVSVPAVLIFNVSVSKENNYEKYLHNVYKKTQKVYILKKKIKFLFLRRRGGSSVGRKRTARRVP